MSVKSKDLKDLIGPFVRRVKKLKVDADKIFISPDGEDVLVTVLELQVELDTIKDEIKAKLETRALEIDPNFKSIQADRVKVFYREYGAKYFVDESQIELLPEGLAEKKITYSVNSKAVEDWVKEKSKMPTGIKEVERKKSLSFSLKK